MSIESRSCRVDGRVEPFRIAFTTIDEHLALLTAECGRREQRCYASDTPEGDADEHASLRFRHWSVPFDTRVGFKSEP